MRKARVPKDESRTQIEGVFTQLERLNDQLASLHEELVPTTATCAYSLAELASWWVEQRCPVRSRDNVRSRLKKWVFAGPGGNLKGKAITTAALDDWLFGLERDGASPNTLNHLRSVLSTVFNQAIKAQKWFATNPIYPIAKRREPAPVRTNLRLEEVPLILRNVGDRWRDLFAAAMMTGMRKGELFGLRKTDVDFEHKVIYVGRSYDFDCTKGGHVDTIPFPDALTPYLTRATTRSTCDLMFPGPEGKIQVGGDAKLVTVMRRAMIRAGIIIGYDHTCRRCLRQVREGKLKVAPQPERYPDAQLRNCQRCGMKLWPTAVPRPMTFHGTRHTAATVMLRAGASLHHVQRLLRHRDPRLTTGTYGHLLVEDLRPAVNLPWAGVSGLEPTAPASPTPPPTTNAESKLEVAPPKLLNVRQVAAVLGVSTATVYALVDACVLPHIRVRNSIRVSQEELDQFMSHNRKGLRPGAIPVWRSHRRATVPASVQPATLPPVIQ